VICDTIIKYDETPSHPESALPACFVAGFN
jgi:hypothetical protein